MVVSESVALRSVSSPLSVSHSASKYCRGGVNARKSAPLAPTSETYRFDDAALTDGQGHCESSLWSRRQGRRHGRPPTELSAFSLFGFCTCFFVFKITEQKRINSFTQTLASAVYDWGKSLNYDPTYRGKALPQFVCIYELTRSQMCYYLHLHTSFP